MLNSLILYNITCKRNNRLLFKNICISLFSGESLVLLGSNGSGKSTFLSILSGILFKENYKENILWNNQNLKKDEVWQSFKNEIHYINHINILKEELTVYENLKYWSILYGSNKHISEALYKLNLMPLLKIPVKFLSVGQKKRVSLSRLIMNPRNIWLLDEPTLGIDKESKIRLECLIKEHLDDQGILIIATHNKLNLCFTYELRFK